jgi:preprotein translocase subunit SecG
VQQFLVVLLYILLAITSLFLICLVLIQRGKGGGLAGAFGGAGGSSAFGTKAGDVFTRVTMIAAGIWIALNMVLVVISNRRTSAWGNTPTASGKSDFSPSKSVELDPSGKPGSSIDLGPGVPPPFSPADTDAPISKGIPDTTLLQPPALPSPTPAPTKKP